MSDKKALLESKIKIVMNCDYPKNPNIKKALSRLGDKDVSRLIYVKVAEQSIIGVFMGLLRSLRKRFVGASAAALIRLPNPKTF